MSLIFIMDFARVTPNLSLTSREWVSRTHTMRLLTVNDVALRGRVSPDAVRYWCDTGKLRSLRTEGTGQRLFEAGVVQKFLAERQREKEDARHA